MRAPRSQQRLIRGASEQVAVQIQHYIQEEGLGPGDFLGREEDLAAEFGVSRPTLREALKLLASGNLIRAARAPAAASSSPTPPTRAWGAASATRSR